MALCGERNREQITVEQKFISGFQRGNLKVGINDEGLARLDERNSTAISAFKQALDEHEKRINDLFTHQQKELKRICYIEEGAYFNGRTMPGCSAWPF